MGAAEAAAIVVGGVDCIMEVGQTTSTIVLGENHQVTMGFSEASDVVSPISSVIGLVTLDPTKAEGVIAFVGDSLMSWYSPGSITGIAVEAYNNGRTKVVAQIFEAMEGMTQDVQDNLKKYGLQPPKEEGVTTTELRVQHTVNAEASMAAMEKLVNEIYQQEPALAEEPVAEEVEPAVIIGGTPAGGSSSTGELDISGFYQGTATATAAKNDTLGEVNELDFRIKQNNNGTATFTRGDIVIEAAYDPDSGELSFEYGFKWNLKFFVEGGTIVARGTMTSEETGEGYTQEVALDMRRTGD